MRRPANCAKTFRRESAAGIAAFVGSPNPSASIIEAIVAMASALDLSIVAEGVEHQDQFDALVDLGVQLMQGYLFDRPLTAEAVGNLGQWFDRERVEANLGPSAVVVS